METIGAQAPPCIRLLALFALAHLVMAAVRGRSSDLPGFLLSRFLSLRTAATLSPENERGSTQIGVSSMDVLTQYLHPATLCTKAQAGGAQ